MIYFLFPDLPTADKTGQGPAMLYG